MSPTRVLGLETSCDETATAVVVDGRQVLASTVASSERLHARFGGVVPEIACRAHLESLVPVLCTTLEKSGMTLEAIDAVAVTNRPGLVGALLVGVSAAKTLAWVLEKPLLAVDHLQAHIYAAHLGGEEVPYPHVTLIVSGGHTSLFLVTGPLEAEMLGATIDDAAGEAFDKVANLLGLLTPESYHGGPVIQRAATVGNPAAVHFPRSLLDGKSLDFSFSGLKTAVLYYCHGQDAGRGLDPTIVGQKLSDVAASFQEAVVDVLVEKTLTAARRFQCRTITVGGGVAANGRLRTRLTAAAAHEERRVFFPPLPLCLDNAVMVAGLGYHLLAAGHTAGLDLDVHAQLVRGN